VLIAVASPPGLVEDGLGLGFVDEVIQFLGTIEEDILQHGRGLALVLEDNKIPISRFDLFSGGVLPGMKFEIFSSGSDEFHFHLIGDGGGGDELLQNAADLSGVAVTDEKDAGGVLFGPAAEGQGEKKKSHQARL
jgi:hypothetical protein